MEVTSIAFSNTPDNFKLNQSTVENLSCGDYITQIASQKRIITPIDVAELARQSTNFEQNVIQKLPVTIDVPRAFAFPAAELLRLMSTLSVRCAYVRIYFGLKDSKMTAFAIPVDEKMEHILNEDMVAVSELPCPPKPGCLNDRIIL